uniref:Uncharacterized protein n=1 Tax=Ditylenchus dipsaci TaxID=166011 RepID=A0A915ER94_9BILA
MVTVGTIDRKMEQLDILLCVECRKIRDGKRVSKDTPVPSLSVIPESYHSRQQYHFHKKAGLGEWIVRNRSKLFILFYFWPVRELLDGSCTTVRNGSKRHLEGRIDPNKPQQKYAE